MGLRIAGAPLRASVCVYFLVFILQAAQSQRNVGTQQRESPRAALRQTLQWSHNGKVFSILSQGSEYQPPRRRGAPQEQVQARPLTIIKDASDQPAAQQQEQQQPRRPASAPRNAADRPPPLQSLVRGREHRQHHHQRPAPRPVAHRSSKANETHEKVTVSPPLPRREDMMVGDDPYDRYKSSDGDNPYYNYYDVYERPRPRSRPGYGTRIHQYGERAEGLLTIGSPFYSSCDLLSNLNHWFCFLKSSLVLWFQVCLTSCPTRTTSKPLLMSRASPCTT